MTERRAVEMTRTDQPATGEVLVRAVLERRVVRLIYDGLRRTVEPHLVGLHEAGEPILVGYQTGGFSHSGDLPGWRTFITTEINDVELQDEEFRGARPGFDARAYAMLEIFARA